MHKMNIAPFFNEHYCCLGASCSQEYIPYLAVYLQSIKEYSSNKHNYDIIIFESGLRNEDKVKLSEMLPKSNFSLRFVNPEKVLEPYHLKFPPHYSVQCYYRLVAPLVLKDFKKVLFTDIDLIFQKDPMDLFDIDLRTYALAACKDLFWSAMLERRDQRNWLEYARESLKLEKPYEYFNTGVMLINIPLFNSQQYSEKLLDMVSRTTYRILEQDALNSFFQTNISYLDTAWNYHVAHGDYLALLSYMPSSCREQYQIDSKKHFIIHYAGAYKPWRYPEEEKADIWWSYARKTFYYGVALCRLIELRTRDSLSRNRALLDLREELEKKHFPDINRRFGTLDYRQHLLYVMNHRTYFRLKKACLRLFSLLSPIPRSKQKFEKKYTTINRLLKEAEACERRWTDFIK